MNDDITTDSMDIKKIIKEHYEKLYPHKFDNLHEMCLFLRKTHSTTLTQGQTGYVNRPISI